MFAVNYLPRLPLFGGFVLGCIEADFLQANPSIQLIFRSSFQVLQYLRIAQRLRCSTLKNLVCALKKNIARDLTISDSGEISAQNWKQSAMFYQFANF